MIFEGGILKNRFQSLWDYLKRMCPLWFEVHLPSLKRIAIALERLKGHEQQQLSNDSDSRSSHYYNLTAAAKNCTVWKSPKMSHLLNIICWCSTNFENFWTLAPKTENNYTCRIKYWFLVREVKHLDLKKRSSLLSYYHKMRPFWVISKQFESTHVELTIIL